MHQNMSEFRPLGTRLFVAHLMHNQSLVACQGVANTEVRALPLVKEQLFICAIHTAKKPKKQ